MNNINFNILIILVISINLIGCKSVDNINTDFPKYRHIRGGYSRNIAEGWRRPDANTEIIPEIPHYQVLILGKFRKFKTNDLQDSTTQTGNWKIKNDTLILAYKNKTVEYYHIDMPYIRNGACLKNRNLKTSAYCRFNAELVKKYEKPRTLDEVNKYENGNTESSGIIKYFYNKPDEKMKKRIGEWLFFDENGALLRSSYYVRGKKIWSKKHR